MLLVGEDGHRITMRRERGGASNPKRGTLETAPGLKKHMPHERKPDLA